MTLRIIVMRVYFVNAWWLANRTFDDLVIADEA